MRLPEVENPWSNLIKIQYSIAKMVQFVNFFDNNSDKIYLFLIKKNFAGWLVLIVQKN